MVKKTYDYKDAEEKLVNCTILYVGGANLYYDEELTELIPAEDYIDLFLAGVVLKSDDYMYKPYACKEGVMLAGEFEFGTDIRPV